MSDTQTMKCTKCLKRFTTADDLAKHQKADHPPGLHQIGPAPWDYEFNPAKGMKIAAVDVNGKMYTGVISDFTEDKKTGEVTLTCEDPEPADTTGWNVRRDS